MQENSDFSIAGTVGVPMDLLISNLIDKVNSDSALNSLFASALENFKKNVEIKEEDNRLLYAFCVGWILNDLIRTTFKGCDSNSVLSNIMKQKRENLVSYKTRLEDGKDFIISTDDETIIDNQFINKLEKQTGHRFTNPFVKLSKEEAQKIHDMAIKQMEETSKKVSK